MQKLFIYSFGVLGIITYCVGLYTFIAQPFTIETNARLYIACFIFGSIAALVFVLLSKTMHTRKKYRCNNKPELSDITVTIYGDEKLLIDGNNIITHL